MDALPDDIQEMIDDFAFLEDWEARYMHVIDMGKAMASLNADEKQDDYKVKGCVSQVWLISTLKDGIFTFRGDSDAHIVKGLVAIVLKIFSHKSAAQILKLDAEAILRQLGLEEHLSPQRSNGLRAMIDRIRHDAQVAL